METKTVSNGWVIVSEDGKRIYDFTFKLTRKESISRYTSLFSRKSWKYHYNKGVRCIKAKQTIELM